MGKSVMRIICFILVLATTLGKVNDIFSFKYLDGNTIMTDFYRLKDNTVDVLIIGTSHAFVNFNNGTLWDEYGITSYDLGSSSQPMWSSYYYLKEALKTQTPELIVLEGFGLSYNNRYSDNGVVIKSTYGMKWSMDKINAIKESVGEERKLEFLIDYARYHTRYSELNRGDFFPKSNYLTSNGFWHYDGLMGQFLYDTANNIEIPDVSHVQTEIDLHEKVETYYRKTIELAQEKGIPIIVMVTPYYISETDQGKYLKAQEIAKEYDVKFLNTNLLLDDIGFDFSKDFHDSGGHMTVEGSQKFSLYVGKYLKDNYNISDRRGGRKYAAWDKCAAYTNQYMHNSNLINSNDLDEISKSLLDTDYWIFMSLDGQASSGDEVIENFLQMQGINFDSSSMWIKENGTLVWESGYEEAEKYIRTTLHDFCMKRIMDKSGNYSNRITVDNQKYQKVTNGLNVVVYDSLSDRVVNSFGIDLDNNYNVVK